MATMRPVWCFLGETSLQVKPLLLPRPDHLRQVIGYLAEVGFGAGAVGGQYGLHEVDGEVSGLRLFV